MPKRYWLMKSEPDVFSIDDLKKAPKKTTMWEGVRNYQARNFLRDEIKKGDEVLYYHSNAKPPGAVGVATVVREGYPDPTQFDASSKYFDAGSKEDNPRWFVVDIKFHSKFKNQVSLDDIKATKSLADMVLVKRGRLSVQPVTAAEWKVINKLGTQ